MKEYKTYIFERTKKRARRQLTYNLTIFAALCGIIYMFFIGIMGIGLSVTGVVFLIAAIFSIKNYDDKFMGITAYGERKEKLIIHEEYFIIGDAKIPFSELNDLVIYVEEYAGMPREIFGIHHGGNNEITFNHRGKNFSFKYIIKNKSDFQQVEVLVKRIENQQKHSMAKSLG